MDDSATSGFSYREYVLIVDFGQLIMQHTHPLNCNVLKNKERGCKVSQREQ